MTSEKLVELFESAARSSLKKKDRFDIDQDAIDNEIDRTIEFLFDLKSKNEEE